MTKVLFVCTANIDRSRTAEDMYKGKPGLEVLSAGTEQSLAKKLVTRELIDWADIILCMEEQHREKILNMSPVADGKTKVLGIHNNWRRGDTELIRLIQEKASEYLKFA